MWRIFPIAVGLSSARVLLPGETVTVEVSEGEHACRTVSIPHRWRTAKFGVPADALRSNEPFSLGGAYDHFEFRTHAGGERSELLISVDRREPGQWRSRSTAETFLAPYYSPNRYAFRVSGPPSIRVATQREWEAGAPLPSFQSPMSVHPAGGVSDTFVLEYQDKVFRRTGDHWLGSAGGGGSYVSRHSGDGLFVSVNSWSGSDLPSGWPMDNSPGKRSGQYFVDIYRINPLVEQISITGTFRNIGPSEFVPYSFWLGKNYFVLPLNREMTKLLFCDTQAIAR